MVFVFYVCPLAQMKTCNQLSIIGQEMIADDTPIPKFNSGLNLYFKIVFLFLICFYRPYTFEMILLTRGRISFGGFLCLPDSFWVMTLLVTEFVASRTYDCTTFSLYGSDVYTCIEFNKIVFLFDFFSFFFCSFGIAAMLHSVLLLLFHTFFLHTLMSDVFLRLPFLDSRLPFYCVKFTMLVVKNKIKMNNK